jgi:hypothetical protein
VLVLFLSQTGSFVKEKEQRPAKPAGRTSVFFYSALIM